MGTPQLNDYHPLMTPDAIVIYPSRVKLLLIACGATGFVALGLFFSSCGRRTPSSVGSAIASVVFFGFCMLYAVVRVARPSPALIIHSSGIFDNASALSAGSLRWDEVSGVFVVRIKRQRFLAIVVKDVEGLLSRQSWLKVRMMKLNVGLVGAAVNIPANTLPISLEELIEKLEQKFPVIQVGR